MNDKNKGTVLLVEDNVKILASNKKGLEAEGCAILTATTIADAREILDDVDVHIHAAVLDIRLPDGNALEKLFPDLRDKHNIPALFLTANASHESTLAALKAGGFEYMTKPYNFEVFCFRVMRMLEMSHAQRFRAFTQAHRLNETEVKISILASRDKAIKSIADSIYLSPNRVRDILTAIYAKLNIDAPTGGKLRALSEMLRENGCRESL